MRTPGSLGLALRTLSFGPERLATLGHVDDGRDAFVDRQSEQPAEFVGEHQRMTVL